MEKIEFAICEMNTTRNVSQKTGELQLHEKHLEYNVRFTFDEPGIKDDEHSPLVEGKYAEETKVLKIFIVGTSKYYLRGELNGRWCIKIIVNGYSEDINVYFEKEVDANEYRYKIDKWIFQ